MEPEFGLLGRSVWSRTFSSARALSDRRQSFCGVVSPHVADADPENTSAMTAGARLELLIWGNPLKDIGR